jgi:hypothetical protein
MQSIFDLCVIFLLWLAQCFSVSYEAINVIIFCFAWPLLTLGLIVWVLVLRRQLKQVTINNEQQ